MNLHADIVIVFFVGAALVVIIDMVLLETFWKKIKTKGRATHMRRGLAVLLALIVGAVVGNVIPTYSTNSTQIPEGLAASVLLAVPFLFVMYFGGNWLRYKSDFFHKWFDSGEMGSTLYLGLMLFLALFCGFMTGALLFDAFGSIVTLF